MGDARDSPECQPFMTQRIRETYSLARERYLEIGVDTDVALEALASIPIALCEAWEKGLIKEGDLVCLAAFGSGFTWGSALMKW